MTSTGAEAPSSGGGDDITLMPVIELANAIRTGDLSSEAVVSAHLDKISRVNPRLNAVVQVADQAMYQAQMADRTTPRGPLHGVPMTIKDTFDTAGVISTAGTLGRSRFIPERDATVVARLRSAGAILIGKTNTSEFTLSFEPENLVYGRTNNPYDVARTPGGSSSGAAAAVAAGLSPFDIGSDLGGSVRLPAHFSGIVGLKPTSGRVPRTGHAIPYAAGATDAFQCVGPLARRVADISLIMRIISGPDWEDPSIVPMPWTEPAEVEVGGLRVAVHTDNGIATPIAPIVATVERVAAFLEPHVGLVDWVTPPEIGRTSEIARLVGGAGGGAFYRSLIDAAGTTEISPKTEWINDIPVLPGDELQRRIVTVDRFRSDMLRFLSRYDVVVCPVNANVALPHGVHAEHRLGFSYTETYNITGWPGVVVRAGTSPEGLPIGVQIVARPWREDVALAVAARIEAEFGGWVPTDVASAGL